MKRVDDAIRRWVGDSEVWVKGFVDRAPLDRQIAAIVAMGSAVRSRGHRRSDVDLLVLYRGKRPRFRAPVEVDIRKYPLDDADRLVAEGNEVVCWALKFGELLYDDGGDWTSLQAEWANRIPLPSADDARQRGGKSLRVAREVLAAGDEDAGSDLMLAALTQFVRAWLIQSGVFPASRPELPGQLRCVSPHDALADLLDDAMFGNSSAAELLDRYDRIAAKHSMDPVAKPVVAHS